MTPAPFRVDWTERLSAADQQLVRDLIAA
ncbi:hypothetical protein, partial [Mycolicibacterium poriferae]